MFEIFPAALVLIVSSSFVVVGRLLVSWREVAAVVPFWVCCLLAMADAPRRAPKRADVAKNSGLQATYSRMEQSVEAIMKRLSVAYNRVSWAVSWAGDASWAIGTTAALLSIPILLELQRETTLLTLQRQRDIELQSIQEQARMMNGGVLEQMKGVGSLITGALSGGAAAADAAK